jgi:hypothetical protein
MENSHDNAMKGPNIALAAPHPDIEMGILQPTPPVEVRIKSLALLYDCFFIALTI